MRKSSFTIIVPIYGVEKYIRQCADTVLGQTYGDIQFIFVNDGTRDRSMQVLEELIEEKYQHLRPFILIINKENEGLPAARKTGVEHSTGDYILHVDSDDWIEYDTVERIAQKADETDSDLICFKVFKEEANRTRVRGNRKYTIDQKETFVRDIMTHKAYGYTVNKCAKRSLYMENKVCFARYGMFEDVFLMTQLVYYAGSYAHIDAPLYHYRRTNYESFTRQKRSVKRLFASRNMLDLYRAFKGDIPGSPIDQSVGRIFYHAAWCSIVYRLNLFCEYPEMLQMIKNTPVGRRNLLPLWQQIFVKLCVGLNFIR
jgi:glycosyltransferase involved in cell wall biosynthesis